MNHELLPFPTPSSGLQPLIEKAQSFISNARSEATKRQCDASWTDFSAWAEALGLTALPAEPATVALFIADRSSLAASTLAGRVSATPQCRFPAAGSSGVTPRPHPGVCDPR